MTFIDIDQCNDPILQDNVLGCSIGRRTSVRSRFATFEDENGDRDIDHEMDYFKDLLSKSIEIETNDAVKDELDVVESSVTLFERARTLDLVNDDDAKMFNDEVIVNVNDVHDKYIERDCNSCQSLGFILSDVFG